MSSEYRGSYRPGGARQPVAGQSWVSIVAEGLERLTTTVADVGILVERAVVDEQADSITVTLFDHRRRCHRTHTCCDVTETYSQGFDPPLSANEAARLIALEIATSF